MLLNDTCELGKRFLTIYLSKKTAKNNTLKQKLPTFHFAKNHIQNLKKRHRITAVLRERDITK